MKLVEKRFEHHFPFPRPLVSDLLLIRPSYKVSSSKIKGGKEWTYTWEKGVSTEDPPPPRKSGGFGLLTTSSKRRPLPYSIVEWRAVLRWKGRLCALVSIMDRLDDKDGGTAYVSDFTAAPIRGGKFRFWLEGSDRAEFDWRNEHNERALKAAADLWKRLE